jgi:hypothetical protein
LAYAVGADEAPRELGQLGTATLYNRYLLRRDFVNDVGLGCMEPQAPSGISE